MKKWPSSAAHRTFSESSSAVHHKRAGWALVAALAGAVFVQTSHAQAQMVETGGYIDRPLTLPKGRLRIDVAPSDYGYMDFNPGGDDRTLNNARGFKLRAGPFPTEAFFGAGAGLGVIDNLEVGTLILPIMMAPTGDFGNLEFYGRYRFLDGDFQLGAQVTLQVPTNHQFGTGIGLPAIWSITDSIRLDTGVEFEMFTGPFQFNFDLPVAFAFQVVESFFIGPRTGMRAVVVDGPGDGVAFPLGIFMGGTVAEKVDITGAITWPQLVETYPGPGSAVHGNIIEFTTGVNLYFDVF